MPDPQLPRVPREDPPPRLQSMWDAAMRDRGEADLIEVAGNAPDVLEWHYDSFYGRMFHGGRVEDRLKQLMRMKLSTLHGCAFCNRGNEKAALEAGVTRAQPDAPADPDAEAFDAQERALLPLCGQMTLANMEGWLDRPLYEALRAHFDDGEFFELGMCMAVLTGMAKFPFTFDLVSREAVCPIRRPHAAERARWNA